MFSAFCNLVACARRKKEKKTETNEPVIVWFTDRTFSICERGSTVCGQMEWTKRDGARRAGFAFVYSSGATLTILFIIAFKS